MQIVLNHVSDRLSHLTGKHRKIFFHHGSYYTTLSYDVIHDVFVLFTFVQVELICF